MLHDVYLDAIKNRESRIATISDTDSRNAKVLERAKDLWTEYAPKATDSALAGVDSSYNREQFQGFHLYVVDAVCVSNDGSILAQDFINKIGIIDESRLKAKSMEMETSVAAKAASDRDLVLIDGSMTSRFVGASMNSSSVSSLVTLINEHRNVAFLAKTSDSRDILGKMGTGVGDIYFFNRVGDKKAGYSKPHTVKPYAESVTVVFARLSDFTPVTKLEIPGEVGEKEVEQILDRMAYGSVSGYPNVLKLAHKTALVSGNDIGRLASIYGLKNEIGAREVLR